MFGCVSPPSHQRSFPSFPFLSFLTMSNNIPSLDNPAVCTSCGASYTDWQWCRLESVCLFCKHYGLIGDRAKIVADAEDRFLWSGYCNRRDFFKRHFAYLAKWCELRGIPNTVDAERLELQVLRTRNWTRDYWH